MNKNKGYKPSFIVKVLLYLFCIYFFYYLIVAIEEYPSIVMVSIVIILLIVFYIANKKNTRRYVVKKSILNKNSKDLDKPEEKNYIIPEKVETIQQEDNILKETIKENVIKTNTNYKLPKLNIFVKDEKIKSIFSSHRKDIILLMYKGFGYDIFNVKKSSSLLIYGMIGSGKSVLIHNIIFGGLLCKKPDELKIIIIDSRKLEFKEYNAIPHLLCPVIDYENKMYEVLENVVAEMDYRLDLLLSQNCKNIWDYNEKISKKSFNIKKIPNILLIIDELNDLLIYDKTIFNNLISKILIDGRITGINIICTLNTLDYSIIDRRLIASFENVISFRTTSSRESRLLFNNDELITLKDNEYKYKHRGIDSKYVYKLKSYYDESIIKYVSSQQNVEYNTLFPKVDSNSSVSSTENDLVDDDPLYNDIVDYCIQTGVLSVSLLQRKFRLGYNRASKIVDVLEKRGVIGPPNGSKPREVLIKYDFND